MSAVTTVRKSLRIVNKRKGEKLPNIINEEKKNKKKKSPPKKRLKLTIAQPSPLPPSPPPQQPLPPPSSPPHPLPLTHSLSSSSSFSSLSSSSSLFSPSLDYRIISESTSFFHVGEYTWEIINPYLLLQPLVQSNFYNNNDVILKKEESPIFSVGPTIIDQKDTDITGRHNKWQLCFIVWNRKTTLGNYVKTVTLYLVQHPPKWGPIQTKVSVALSNVAKPIEVDFLFTSDPKLRCKLYRFGYDTLINLPRLTIHVIVTVPAVKSPESLLLPGTCLDMNEKFSKIYELSCQNKLPCADFIIQSNDNVEFPILSFLLRMTSPVINSFLSHDSKETKDKKLVINANQLITKALVQYFICGRTTVIRDEIADLRDVVALFELCIYYELSDLAKIVVGKLIKMKLNINDAVSIIKMTEPHLQNSPCQSVAQLLNKEMKQYLTRQNPDSLVTALLV